MPRTMLVNKEAELGKILFGGKLTKVSMTELQKKTGICRSTLYNWKKNPYTIPAEKLLMIVKVLQLAPEQKEKIWKCI